MWSLIGFGKAHFKNYIFFPIKNNLVCIVCILIIMEWEVNHEGVYRSHHPPLDGLMVGYTGSQSLWSELLLSVLTDYIRNAWTSSCNSVDMWNMFSIWFHSQSVELCAHGYVWGFFGGGGGIVLNHFYVIISVFFNCYLIFLQVNGTNCPVWISQFYSTVWLEKIHVKSEVHHSLTHRKLPL